MTTNVADNLVALHFRRYPEVSADIYDNALLVRALGSLGVSTVLIPNAAAYDTLGQTVKAFPLKSVAARSPLEVGSRLEEYPLGAEGVGTIRVRVNIVEEVEALAAVINDTKTCELGIDKWAQYQLAGDFMPITRKLDQDEELSSEILESIPGERVVIKKSGGGASSWIAICDKANAASNVAEMRERIAAKLSDNPNIRQDLVLQEFVIADRIEGLHPDDDRLSSTESNLYKLTGKRGHELRFYCFLRGVGNRVPHEYFVNLRAFDDNNDGKFIYINQNDLPEGASLLAELIADRFIKQTGSDGAMIAIDLFHGQRAADDQPKWLVREINAKDPMMASSDRSFKAAYAQRAKLGRLLSDVARKPEGKEI